MANRARLTGIEDDREITSTSAPQFWYACQNSILLALKEQGVLNDMQYRFAEDKLKRQLRPAGGEAN